MTRLIDADALAKFIDYGHLNNPDEKLYSENDIREMIDMMPTQLVDAVPVRHGKWICENEFLWYTARCSRCGYKRTTDIKATNWNLWKYCPMCGARMDVDDVERKEE